MPLASLLRAKLARFSVILLFYSPLAGGATQTIASLPAYNQQRPCATPCFWNGDPNNVNAGDILGYHLGCKSRASDDCFCRADLALVATSWLSTCVLQGCSSNTLDMSSAFEVYDEYCENVRGGITTIDQISPVTAATPTTSRVERGTSTSSIQITTATVVITKSGVDRPLPNKLIWIIPSLILLFI